jgi:hypothetical protein
MKQVDSASCNVLAKFARSDAKTLLRKNLKQFGMNQVDLAKIGTVRMLCLGMEMLHGLARVGVPFHTNPFNKPNLALRALAECVLRVAVHRDHNGSIHACLSVVTSRTLRAWA